MSGMRASNLEAGAAAAAGFGAEALGGSGFAADAFAGSAGLAAGASDFVAAASAPSRPQITSPSDTLSPTLTFMPRTTPADGAGTSIVALSDSSTIRGASFSTRSPSLTSTSITRTPL